MSPLFTPVKTTSPDPETYNETFVALPVKSIADAVNIGPDAPLPPFIAYDAVSAYELVPYICPDTLREFVISTLPVNICLFESNDPNCVLPVIYSTDPVIV